jgi:hypothetical protein
MPLAGSKDADRARAHLRWAERYSRHDDPHKAAAHFGRALEYDSRSTKSQKFGVGGQDTELMRHMANAGFAAGATAAVAGAAALPYVTQAAYDAGSNVLQVAKGAAKQVSDYMWPRKSESYTREVAAGNNTDHNNEPKESSGKSVQRAYGPNVEEGGKSDQRAYGPNVEEGGKSDQRAYGPNVEDGGKSYQRAYGPKVEDGGKSDQRAYGPKVEDGGKSDQRAYGPSAEEGGKSDRLEMYEYGDKTARLEMDEYGGKTDDAPKISDARSSRGSYPLLGPAEARPNKQTIGRGIPGGSW